MDQRAGSYDTATATPRWTMRILEFMLNRTRINAQSLHALNNQKDPRKTDSFYFGENLGKALVMPLIKER